METLTDRSELYRKVNNNSPSDRSEVDRKVNNNSPSDQKYGANSRSIKTNISPRREQVGVSSLQNNNSSSGMDQEGYNDNDEYYVPIQTRLDQIIV